MHSRFAHRSPSRPVAGLLLLLLVLAFLVAGDRSAAGLSYPSVVSPAEAIL